MFCIQLIYKSGGSSTILGKTIEVCKENCSRSKGDWLVATIPYEVVSVYWPWREDGMLDVSVPSAWWEQLGESLKEKYGKE